MNDTQTAHTPGPWEIDRIETSDDFPEVYIQTPAPRPDLKPRHICQVFDQHTDEDMANARLIAAAPDLLQACKALSHHAGRQLDQSATHDGLINAEALAYARAAIAKAQGNV